MHGPVIVKAGRVENAAGGMLVFPIDFLAESVVLRLGELPGEQGEDWHRNGLQDEVRTSRGNLNYVRRFKLDFIPEAHAGLLVRQRECRGSLRLRPAPRQQEASHCSL